MKRAIKSIWNSFKTKPMKFGMGMLFASISLYIFFGDVNIKFAHDKTKVEINTSGRTE